MKPECNHLKNIVKTFILFIQFKINVFNLKIFYNFIYSCDGEAEFSAVKMYFLLNFILVKKTLKKVF